MKSHFVTSLKTLGIALVLLAGVTFVSAYTNPLPPGTFPNGNVASPVNTGSQAQVKTGNLTVLGEFASGGATILGGNVSPTLVVGNMNTWGAARFYNNVAIAGYNFNGGGELPIDLYVSDLINNKGTITSQSVAHPLPQRETICALYTGQLVICDPDVAEEIEVGDLQVVPQTCSAVFTDAGYHSFPVPDGVTSLVVKMWGGGGGGAANTFANQSKTGGAGGGGAFMKVASLPVVPGSTLQVEVGIGGARGANNGSNGQNGGESRISYVSNQNACENIDVRAQGGFGGTAGANGGAGGDGGSFASYNCTDHSSPTAPGFSGQYAKTIIPLNQGGSSNTIIFPRGGYSGTQIGEEQGYGGLPNFIAGGWINYPSQPGGGGGGGFSDTAALNGNQKSQNGAAGKVIISCQ